ncbi:MAG: patatin-like phospholipase family protein [Deltaproteobacteria bacterium]|nr:patatin-like phospholipase family protein [Deltaproteobacteria bacterium]
MKHYLYTFLCIILIAGCSSAPPPKVATTNDATTNQTTGDTTEPQKPVEPPLLKVIDPPKIALVLGGGGARGFAHIGVLRILEREKIPINLIVGTSVGSLIGALYASDPNTFELEWTAFKINKEDLFDFSIFAAKTGPVKGEAIQAFVSNSIKVRNIEQFPVPYIAIAADLNTGERVEFTKGSIVDAVRASVSIPGVFTPARIGNRTLVDGGVVANLAVDVARAHGADIVIASDINQNVIDYNVTDVVSIILQSINIMMGEAAKVQSKLADVVIVPKIGDVGTLDFSQKKRCMAEGISATSANIAAIRAAIDKYYKDHGGVAPSAQAARLESLKNAAVTASK